VRTDGVGAPTFQRPWLTPSTSSPLSKTPVLNWKAALAVGHRGSWGVGRRGGQIRTPPGRSASLMGAQAMLSFPGLHDGIARSR
jgi:hypothetical protein